MSPEGSHVRRLLPACSPRGSSACGMYVLACFSPTYRALTAAQIAKQLDLAPATVESVAANLVILGYLDLDPTGVYRMATRHRR
jgi:DNA-binding IclR family transcriptional regulator